MQLISDRILRVVANPFCAPLDQKGRPCGFAQDDPEHYKGMPRYVGAKLVRTLVAKRPAWGGQQSRFDTAVEYDLRPKDLLDTHYHRGLIRRGALIAADADTAKWVRAEFSEPAQRLAAAKSERIESWTKINGKKPPIESWKIENWPSEGASQ